MTIYPDLPPSRPGIYLIDSTLKSANNVEPECKERKVVTRVKNREYEPAGFFLNSATLKEREYEIQYSELMMSCKGIADHTEGLSPLMKHTYYISRGLHNESAIVFKETENGSYSPYVGVTDVSLIHGSGKTRSLETRRINDSFYY